MALFTNLFTRDVAPYSTKARWHKVEIENNAIVSTDFKNPPTLYSGTSGLFLEFSDISKVSVLTYYVDAEMTSGPSANKTFTQQMIFIPGDAVRIQITAASVTIPKLTVYLLAKEK